MYTSKDVKNKCNILKQILCHFFNTSYRIEFVALNLAKIKHLMWYLKEILPSKYEYAIPYHRIEVRDHNKVCF